MLEERNEFIKAAVQLGLNVEIEGGVFKKHETRRFWLLWGMRAKLDAGKRAYVPVPHKQQIAWLESKPLDPNLLNRINALGRR